MLTLPQRLATLAAKAKSATRTAKDGEEYSQLVFEVENLEVGDTEVNALFASPRAYEAFTQLHAAVANIEAIALTEKLESACVVIRVAAVSAQNGPEFTFTGCRVDKIKLVPGTMMLSFRVTSKPALDAKFGELIARLGHSVMIEVRGETPADQAELPLNGVGANERGTSSVGTPEQERERAHKRERDIARDLEAVH